MSSLFWKISVTLLVNIQVIKAGAPLDLLPNNTICGNSSHLDQFPWMALIEYERSNGKRDFLCGGSIINKRYILTSAVCVKGGAKGNLAMSGVRLGEFNAETDPDCFKTVNGLECAPSPLDIEIEEQIVHEDFDIDDKNKQHDIALLRLKEDIKFTETVRPICLPTTSKERSETHVGERLTVVGWGRTETRSSVSVKSNVKVPVQDIEACRAQYKQNKLDLGDGQFCAGGELGQDSCRGDSGNTLMATNINEDAKGYLYAVGIVSLGPSPCGLKDWPSVYTNISTYMPWILAKLRP